MEALNQFLGELAGIVWGLPLVFLLVGTGLFVTISLGFVQFKAFKHALKVVAGKYDDPNDPGEITHFQALSTALSATVGLGNIAGVAVAIKVGGPGATFWMILVGILGMALKFSECSLALMYRKVDERGVVHGGPMYYIELGLGKAWKPMATFFAFAVVCSSFGAANMFQTNQVASIFESSFGIKPIVSGVVLSILTAVVIIGGIRRIGQVTSKLVPFMGAIYILGSLFVIFTHAGHIPDVISMVFTHAFTGTAAVGGFAGAAVREVMKQGVRRACFSNEAGLGSAPIAHSAASTNEPIREGVVALLGPFIDTIVICSMTAFVILVSDQWTGDTTGVELTAKAFDTALPGFGSYFVPIAVFLFAYSTLLSWSYYGERGISYMLGEKSLILYKVVFCLLAIVGAIWKIDPVLNFSDIMLALMAIPNIIALYLLFPKLKKESKSYFQRLANGEFERGAE